MTAAVDAASFLWGLCGGLVCGAVIALTVRRWWRP